MNTTQNESISPYQLELIQVLHLFVVFKVSHDSGFDLPAEQ